MGSEGGTANRQPDHGPPSRLHPLRLTSDPELLTLARSGSDDAFGELARRHRPALLARCARLVGRDCAEDAVQDALLKALVALRGDAAQPADIRPWLVRVAHNVSIDLLRRRALEPGADPAGRELASVCEPPIDVLERRRELRSIVREIGRLPERQRQALVLRAIEGHGYEQIAAALDASEGMVRQLIYRARERVRAGAAATLCPPWLIRMLHRGAPPGHELAVGGGVLAGGGALKLGAVVTAAGLAIGGAAFVSQRGGGGPEPAHAADAASKPAMHRSARSPQRPYARSDSSRHPRSVSSAARLGAARHPRVRVAPGGAQVAAIPIPNAAPAPAQPPRGGGGGHQPAQSSPPPDGGVQGGSTGPPPAVPPPPAGGGNDHSTSSTPPPATEPPAPPPPHEQPPAARPSAPAVNGHVTHYGQSPGFGGPLTIQRSNGESVTAYFGELATLNCYFVRDGHVVEHTQCPKARLQPGTAFTLAEHSVNSSGHDVWTHVELVVPAS